MSLGVQLVQQPLLKTTTLMNCELEQLTDRLFLIKVDDRFKIPGRLYLHTSDRIKRLVVCGRNSCDVACDRNSHDVGADGI